ncbi:uroporphyrinogen-III synthase [Glaciecola sp. 1036]|uniref:uroporphyrinogen-III synthase n=1 Tax=Alteromonadaceae TaxID=72275 RepID=UPI003D026667
MFLITRPKEKAKTSADAFIAAGLVCTCCPAMDIEFVSGVKLSQNFFDIGIITSTYAADWLNQHTDVRFGTIICIGEATLETLNEEVKSRTDILLPKQHNSESVLDLSIFKDVESKSVLILKGEKGRDLLARSLSDKQAKVSVAEVYKRVPFIDQNTVRQVEEKPIRCIIVTSNDIAEQILDNFTFSWLTQRHWIAASKRIADYLKTQNIVNVSVSKGASDDVMISAAKTWQERDLNLNEGQIASE